jgi:hypothetical protein
MPARTDESMPVNTLSVRAKPSFLYTPLALLLPLHFRIRYCQ